VEHEDDLCDGSLGHDPRDPIRARVERLRVRAAREVPPALHARGRAGRLVDPVGDGGLQAATAREPQRHPIQTHLGHVDRIQEHRVEDIE